MAKKEAKKKKSSKSGSVKSKKASKKGNEDAESILIENFASLQDVMADMSAKFDDLSKEMSRLLAIFEKAAKSLMEKDFNIGETKKDNKEVVDKLDKLLDQNRIIARGLTLLHEANQEMPEPPQPGPNQGPRQQPIPPAMPQKPMGPPGPRQGPSQAPQESSMTKEVGQGNEMSGYQKSISAKGNQQQ